MRSRSPAGVLYAEDFDDPQPVVELARPSAPPAEPIVIDPTFSLADLHRAAERAQEEGRALAHQEAELATTALRAAALSEIASALQRSRNDLEAVAERSACATASTLLAMMASLLPAFARSQAPDETAALLRLLLPAMLHEPDLSIRVHPAVADGLRQDLAALLAGQTNVTWVTSDSMEPGDVSVRWNGGTMVRDTTALCAQVAALVMPHKTPSDTNQESQDGQ